VRICAPDEDDMPSLDLGQPRKGADLTAEEKGEKGSGKRESFIIRIPNSENGQISGKRSESADEKMTREKSKVEDTETEQDTKLKGNTH
jgi:hypothetical protein